MKKIIILLPLLLLGCAPTVVEKLIEVPKYIYVEKQNVPLVLYDFPKLNNINMNLKILGDEVFYCGSLENVLLLKKNEDLLINFGINTSKIIKEFNDNITKK